MRNIWTLAKKEYHHYFISPIAYMIAFMIMLLLGIIFYANILGAVINQYVPSIQFILGPLITLLLFTTPAITMRSISEEHKQGTLETLLTAPVREAELVIGKWLGAFLFSSTVVGLSAIFPLILNRMVEPGLDLGLVFSSYLGIILLISCFIAIGIYISTLFTNQIAAFFATIASFLVLWMISYPTQVLPPGTASSILKYLDLSQHYYNTFAIGLVELKDIVFYLSVTALGLMFGMISIESRRWK